MAAVLDFPSSPSFGEKVIDDDMLGSLAKECRHFARGRRAEAPRCCKLGIVKHRTFKLHRIEDFRESVHRTFGTDSWLKFRDPRVSDTQCTARKSSLPDEQISMRGKDLPKWRAAPDDALDHAHLPDQRYGASAPLRRQCVQLSRRQLR